MPLATCLHIDNQMRFATNKPLKSMLPTSVTALQRVILLTHNKEKDTISLRHFCISVAPSGLTKGIKALVQGKVLPDLSRFNDIADFVERSGYASESEGDDAAASRVTLGQNLGHNNLAQRQSRVKLHEVRLAPGLLGFILEDASR
jgi:ribosome biogenesis protein SSF1/2